MELDNKEQKTQLTEADLDYFNNKRISGNQVITNAFAFLDNRENVVLSIKTLNGGNKVYKSSEEYKVNSINNIDYISPTGLFNCHINKSDAGVVELQLGQI